MVRRRSPLFSTFTGIVPELIVAFDWLHTMSLGVFQFYLSHLFHFLVGLDMWQTKDGNMVARVIASVCRLAPDVERWQKTQTAAGRDVTMVYMNADTFGTSAHPTASLKGAQTNWLLEFLFVCICHGSSLRLVIWEDCFWRQVNVCTL